MNMACAHRLVRCWLGMEPEVLGEWLATLRFRRASLRMLNVQLLSLYAPSLHNMDSISNDATKMLDGSVVQLLYRGSTVMPTSRTFLLCSTYCQFLKLSGPMVEYGSRSPYTRTEAMHEDTKPSRNTSANVLPTATTSLTLTVSTAEMISETTLVSVEMCPACFFSDKPCGCHKSLEAVLFCCRDTGNEVLQRHLRKPHERWQQQRSSEAGSLLGSTAAICICIYTRTYIYTYIYMHTYL